MRAWKRGSSQRSSGVTEGIRVGEALSLLCPAAAAEDELLDLRAHLADVVEIAGAGEAAEDHLAGVSENLHRLLGVVAAGPAEHAAHVLAFEGDRMQGEHRCRPGLTAGPGAVHSPRDRAPRRLGGA